ncbi:hypothetical protein BC829DRAFT_384744 [Chytridium lagenaria]|nr:hypothetical protein BC829DRAFT_384744 [Chytridium lagenaria]
MLTSIQEWIHRYEHYENTERRQKPLVEYITFLINTRFFQTLILLTILVNAITVGDEARVVSTQIDFNTPNIYHLLNLTYLTIYTLEFSLKCYINPSDIGEPLKTSLISSSSSYPYLNGSLLSLNSIPILYGFEFERYAPPSPPSLTPPPALRVLRIVSVVAYSPSLKVVVTALLRTLQYHVLDILVLLLLVMFVAGVFGNTVFGQDGGNAAFGDWGTLGDAFMTLFVVVCGDGWLPYQQRLENDGYPYSELFVSTFFFVGNNIRDATEDEAVERTRKRRAAKAIKKELFLRKQETGYESSYPIENKKFQDVIQELAGTLRHDDYVPMKPSSFNLQWLETFVVTLTHKENTMYRCQQLQFAMAETLAEYMDRRLSLV